MSVFNSLIDQAEVIKALQDAVLASRNNADKTASCNALITSA